MIAVVQKGQICQKSVNKTALLSLWVSQNAGDAYSIGL